MRFMHALRTLQSSLFPFVLSQFPNKICKILQNLEFPEESSNDADNGAPGSSTTLSSLQPRMVFYARAREVSEAQRTLYEMASFLGNKP
ncbi:hypothetical protein AMTRI_Chr10g229080 [Amborella trichopoda]